MRSQRVVHSEKARHQRAFVFCGGGPFSLSLSPSFPARRRGGRFLLAQTRGRSASAEYPIERDLHGDLRNFTRTNAVKAHKPDRTFDGRGLTAASSACFIFPTFDFFLSFFLFILTGEASLPATCSHTSVPHVTTHRVYLSTHPVCGTIFYSSPSLSTRAGPNSFVTLFFFLLRLLARNVPWIRKKKKKKESLPRRLCLVIKSVS